MKRYFIVNEFFGLRVYDSEHKKETYFPKTVANQVKQLLAENYIEIKSDKDHLISPLKISMNITRKCNLRCEQCFSDSGLPSRNELTTSEICSLFDQMYNNGTYFICIGGGEPFMRKDLFEILEYGKNKRLAISIVTNGLLLNDEIINHLNECDLDTLWISLDGLEKNHEMLRGRNTYIKTLQTLELVQKLYSGKKAIRVSLNQYNIGEFRELIKVAEKYQFDIIRFTPLLAFGRAIGKDLTISQEQYVDFMSQICKIESCVKIIHPNSLNNDKFWINSEDFGCHCGREAVWIDELGNYYSCIFYGESHCLGNIKTDSWDELWNKSLESSKICGNNICMKCDNYKVCRGGCRARAYMTTGNINAIDPLCVLRKNQKKISNKKDIID